MRPGIPFLVLLVFAYHNVDASDISCLPCNCHQRLNKELYVFCRTNDLDSLMPVFDGFRKRHSILFALLMDSNNATTIPEGLFKDIDIKAMRLSLPALNHLSSSTFESQGHVMSILRIHQSSLTSVPTEALAPLKKLTTFGMENAAGLSHIQRLKIPSAKYCRLIILTNNNIKSIAADAFIDFTGMSGLDLGSNHLTDISSLVLPKSIKLFSARNNKLNVFPTKALSAISDGAEVDVSNNNIADFSTKDVAGIVAKDFHLNLQGNPINCNCSFKAWADFWGSVRVIY